MAIDYGNAPASSSTPVTTGGAGKRAAKSFLNLTVEIKGVRYQVSAPLDLNVEGTKDIPLEAIEMVSCNINSATPKTRGAGLAEFL